MNQDDRLNLDKDYFYIDFLNVSTNTMSAEGKYCDPKYLKIIKDLNLPILIKFNEIIIIKKDNYLFCLSEKYDMIHSIINYKENDDCYYDIIVVRNICCSNKLFLSYIFGSYLIDKPLKFTFLSYGRSWLTHKIFHDVLIGSDRSKFVYNDDMSVNGDPLIEGSFKITTIPQEVYIL